MLSTIKVKKDRQYQELAEMPSSWNFHMLFIDMQKDTTPWKTVGIFLSKEIYL